MASEESGDRKWTIPLAGPRALLFVALAVVATVTGLALAALAIVPDIEFVRSQTLQGSVPSGDRLNVSFPVELGLTELHLDVGNCTVFVTALDHFQWDRYMATGELPNPQLTCDNRNASFQYQLEGLVVENRGFSTEAYQIVANLYSVQATQAYLVVPALPLLVGGPTAIMLWSFRRAVARLDARPRTEQKR